MEPTPHTPQVVQETPDTLENKRAHAMSVVLSGLQKHLRDTPPSNVIQLFGGEFPVRPDSVVDTIVADAQKVFLAADTAHKEAIEKGDYSQEKAAAMLAGIFKNNELLIANFAEIMEHFPEIASQVASLTPTLAALILEKNRHEEYNSTLQPEIEPVNNSANDKKYNVAA